MNNTTPYEAVFGEKSRMGLAASVPREFLAKITPGMMEEEFEELLDEDRPSSPSPSSPPPSGVSTTMKSNG